MLSEKFGLPIPKDCHVRKNLICFDFLRSLGFLNSDGTFADGIAEQIVSDIEKQLKSDTQISDVDLCIKASIIVILSHLGHRGLPAFILMETANFVAGILLAGLKRKGLKNLQHLLRAKQI